MEARGLEGSPFTPTKSDLQKALHYLDESDRDLTLPYLIGLEYVEGTTIIKEGDSGDWMAFVVEGRLAVKKETDFPGKHILVAILETGSLIGEISGLEKGKRAATVEVVEKCRLLRFSSDDFENLLQLHPYLGIKILKRILHVLGVRVKKADDRLAKVL